MHQPPLPIANRFSDCATLALPMLVTSSGLDFQVFIFFLMQHPKAICNCTVLFFLHNLVNVLLQNAKKMGL
jgi:hypothetical protein